MSGNLVFVIDGSLSIIAYGLSGLNLRFCFLDKLLEINCILRNSLLCNKSQKMANSMFCLLLFFQYSYMFLVHVPWIRPYLSFHPFFHQILQYCFSEIGCKFFLKFLNQVKLMFKGKSNLPSLWKKGLGVFFLESLSNIQVYSLKLGQWAQLLHLRFGRLLIQTWK